MIKSSSKWTGIWAASIIVVGFLHCDISYRVKMLEKSITAFEVNQNKVATDLKEWHAFLNSRLDKIEAGTYRALKK